MPATYTPDPTVAQAPSAAPAPDNYPLLSLPVDGDPANAASVAQSYKALGDNVAWLKTPFAPGSTWQTPLRRYRNALLHTRALIDHHGLPGGKWTGYRENWGDGGLVLKNAVATANWSGPWDYAIDSVAGSINAGWSVNGLGCPQAFMNSAASATDTRTAIYRSRAPATAGPTKVVVSQWDQVGVGATAPGSFEPAGGIVDFSLGSDFIVALRPNNFQTAALPGAAFVKRLTDTHWFAYYKPTGGSATYVDTTLLCDATVRRFAIEIIGATVSDDSNARLLMWADGSLVVNVSVNLALTYALPFFTLWHASTTASVNSIAIGEHDFASNLWASDVYR